MTFSSMRRLIATRQLAWLLALALWLPMAQWAAATHALLHLQASGEAGRSDAPAHLPQSCDSCIVAATLVSAAPAAEFLAPLPPPLPQAQPLAPRCERIASAAGAPYDSRAPPSLHA